MSAGNPDGAGRESAADPLLVNNERFADNFTDGHLDVLPRRRLAVLTCMDARIRTYGVLGLAKGDAHIIRNAGGVVTDDAIRSLTISQRMLETRSIMVIQHTKCGMTTFTETGFRRVLLDDVGVTPPWALEAFDDVEESVRQSLARIHISPFIEHKDDVRGFVYDVTTGRLHEVEPATEPVATAPLARRSVR